MRYVEFPHEVTFQTASKVSDGAGGKITTWINNGLVFGGFLDTPSSKEVFTAQQLQNPLDRYLYYPYRTDVDPKMRCTCEGDTYELVGRPLDQGGQHEVMKVALKLVPHGS